MTTAFIDTNYRMCTSLFLMTGVGMAMVLITAYCSFYYPIIIAWTIRYMVASFYDPLPWTNCNNAWNTENCYVRATHVTNGNISDVNSTSSPALVEGTTIVTVEYDTVTDDYTVMNATEAAREKIRASEEFWK